MDLWRLWTDLCVRGWLSDLYKLVHFHFTRLQSYIYTAKACSTLTWVKGESQFNSNLSEETYLEGQWEHCNDDSYHRIEHEVKDVGDGPVGPSGESVLLHHYQVLLWFVLHQHRHVNLMRGEREGGERGWRERDERRERGWRDDDVKNMKSEWERERVRERETEREVTVQIKVWNRNWKFKFWNVWEQCYRSIAM